MPITSADGAISMLPQSILLVSLCLYDTIVDYNLQIQLMSEFQKELNV